MEYNSKWNVTKKETLLKIECHSKKECHSKRNVNQNGMSSEIECHSNWSVT